MAVVNNPPPPLGDPIAQRRRPGFSDQRPDPQEGTVSKPWGDYFSHLIGLNETFPTRVRSVYLSAQSAGISATDMTDGTLTAGRYRLSYNARVTTIGGLGETVTINLAWTDNGVSRTHDSSKLDGTVLANHVEGGLLIYADALAPITYAVDYSAALTMVYALDVILEEVDA